MIFFAKYLSIVYMFMSHLYINKEGANPLYVLYLFVECIAAPKPELSLVKQC